MPTPRRQKPKTLDDLFLEVRARAIRDGQDTPLWDGRNARGEFTPQGDFREPLAERLHTAVQERIEAAFFDKRLYHPLPACVVAYFQGR